LIDSLASGEQPSGAESSDALVILNQMLDAFQAERTMIFSVQRFTQDVSANPFFLTAGQQRYTLGTGGNFNIPRPARISRYAILSLLNPAQPLELPLEELTPEGWAGKIPVKNIQSSLPQYVFDDQGFPSRNLDYWCVPNIQVQAVFYVWVALTTFPDLSTDITFPPGYLEMLRYNLAIRLAPEWTGGPANPAVMMIAKESKARVESLNIPLIESHCELAIVGTAGKRRVYNWLSDNANTVR
jgi:hypothetical protein